MPIINFTEDLEGYQVFDIYDGRHRTAFLYAKGLETIPAVVPTHQKKAFIDAGLAREATPEEEHAIKNLKVFPQSQQIHIDY